MNLVVTVMVAVVMAVAVICNTSITIVIIITSTTKVVSTAVVDVLFIIGEIEVMVNDVNTRITRTRTCTSVVVFHLLLR